VAVVGLDGQLPSEAPLTFAHPNIFDHSSSSSSSSSSSYMGLQESLQRSNDHVERHIGIEAGGAAGKVVFLTTI
jgi:hypothetical protein